MNKATHGTIVALEYRSKPKIGFADIVEEFDIALHLLDARTRSLTWDCDDVAFIDRDYLRVALGWLPATAPHKPWYLIIAVGLAPGTEMAPLTSGAFDYITDAIADRTRQFLPYSSAMHGEAMQPVGPALMDSVFGLLRHQIDPPAAPGTAVEEVTRAPIDPYADLVSDLQPDWDRAETGPGADRERTPEAGPDTRTGQTPTEGDAPPWLTNPLGQMLLTRAEPTQPLRLTIHTLSLSLMLYVPPVGAFMFAYAFLRDVFPVAA